ncbi:MAG: hypothetical protein LW806_02050 [Planctomycetaceae bacterium]|nr:hypothetical protein [Planctomycetaceae bacterium]
MHARSLRAFLLGAGLGVWPLVAPPLVVPDRGLATGGAGIESAGAQVLDLGGPSAGPKLPDATAAAELAKEMSDEATRLERDAAGLTGEALAAAKSRARLRRLAALLLELGATRPWNESAPVVSGSRVVGMLNRTDALIASAAAGRRSKDGAPLPQEEARRAVELLEQLANMQLDRVRAACAGSGPALPTQLADALSATLAPLVGLCSVVDGRVLEDAWPLVDDGRDVEAVRAATRADIESLRNAAAKLPDAAGGAAVRAALDACIARGTSPTAISDLRMIDAAVETLAWLDAMRNQKPPRPLPDAAIARAMSRVSLALEDLAVRDATATTQTAADRGRERLAAIESIAEASQTMLLLRDDADMPQASRQALADASASLLGAELAGDERARVRVAERILVACAAAERLLAREREEAPRDLKEIARALDRDGRIAVKALPTAFAGLAADPSRAVEPEHLSALERVNALDLDRTRVARMQSLIDRVGALDAKSGRAFAAQLKRTAKLLLDPLKRDEARNILATLDAQSVAALPFAYEDELKRRTDRALVLTGGRAAEVVEAAGVFRKRWAEALGAGSHAGVDTERMLRVARLLSCLRDLDQIEEPVTREKGDRLALWGGWASRRAALSPAAQDLVARSVLACQSMLAANSADGDAQLERDVAALERAIPLVTLTARLERVVVPAMIEQDNDVAAMLAPLIQSPAPDSFLADEWSALNVVDRALFESEFARRKGENRTRDALAAYLASVCNEISTRAFGTPMALGAQGPVRGGSMDKPVAPNAKPAGAATAPGTANTPQNPRP